MPEQLYREELNNLKERLGLTAEMLEANPQNDDLIEIREP